METGLNDPNIARRIIWAAVPMALALWKELLSAMTARVDLESWATSGIAALIASLIALAPPTTWWRVGALRIISYALCWLPLFLADLGLIITVVLAPVLCGAAVSLEGGIESDEEGR